MQFTYNFTSNSCFHFESLYHTYEKRINHLPDFLKLLKNNTIEKRDDGFTLSYGTRNDLKKIQKLVNELSDESKRFFHPWIFKKEHTIKEKIGKIVVNLSLIPQLGQIIKKIFPYAYYVILKVESPDSELVGYLSCYFFKKRNDGYYEATTGGAMSEKYRGMGLGTWIRGSIFDVAKKEHVKLLRAGAFSENKNIIKIVVDKLGWKVVGKRKIKSCNGEIREELQLIKEL